MKERRAQPVNPVRDKTTILLDRAYKLIWEVTTSHAHEVGQDHIEALYMAQESLAGVVTDRILAERQGMPLKV